jgi:hypothetical protein
VHFTVSADFVFVPDIFSRSFEKRQFGLFWQLFAGEPPHMWFAKEPLFQDSLLCQGEGCLALFGVETSDPVALHLVREAIIKKIRYW